MALDGLVHVLDSFGPIAPSTLTQPVRFPEVKFGDGIGVEEGTTNLITNPSFETGTTGWSAGGHLLTTGAGTLTRDTTRFFLGTASLKFVATGALGGPEVLSTGISVTAGQAVTVSAQVYVESGTVQVSVITGTGTVYNGVTANSASSSSASWQRLTVTHPGTASHDKVFIAVRSVGGAATFYVDAVQVEQKAYATSYTDGSLGSGFTRSRNLLPSAAATFEDGGLGGWLVAGGATRVNSGAFAEHGTRSLLVTLGTAGALGSGVAQTFPVFTVGRTYTISATVQVAPGTVGIRLGITGIGASPVSSRVGTSERLTFTFTASASAHEVYLLAGSASTAGQTFFLDAVQVEEGSTATAFVDDFGAGEDKTPGNLLPAAAQSFEDDTAGGWTASGGTFSVSSSLAFAGTRSGRVDKSQTVTVAFAPTVTVTPGRAYTATAAINIRAGGDVALDMRWLDAAGNDIGGTPRDSVTAGLTWVRSTTSGIAPAGATRARIRSFSDTGTATGAWHIDAVRLSEGTADAAYRWNGAEHASTSTRAAGRVVHPVTGVTPGSLTMIVRLRESVRPVSAAFATLFASTNELFRLIFDSGGYRAAKHVGGVVAITSPLGPAAAVGDDVFLALTFNGTSLTLYRSSNGAALTTQSLSSSTVPASPTSFEIGSQATALGPGAESNSPVEQVLVFNAALSAAEVGALAFGGPKDYTDDPRIVYAAATASTRGTPVALTAAGTGRFRSARTLTAALDDITGWDVAGRPAGATHKITVPSGSGVGEGQFLSFRADAATDRYRVLRSQSGLGADELFVVPV